MSDATSKEKPSQSSEGSSSTASTSSTWTADKQSASASTASSVASVSSSGSAGSAKPVGSAASASSSSGSSAAPSGSKSKRIVGIVVAVVAVVAVIVGVAIALGNSGFYDSSSKDGQAPYKTDEEIQAELNRTVEEGMLNISIASIIEFQNGSSQGTAYIENVPSNKYVMKVTITLDDGGDVVYESGGIKPDSYIETIELKQSLDAGTYPATATFTAYDPDSLDNVGQAAAKVTLVINE